MSFFNEDQTDCLKELMNIAYGDTAARIAKRINSFCTMHVPHLGVIEGRALSAHVRDKFSAESCFYTSHAHFSGDIAGETLFVLDQVSANNLSRYTDGHEAQPVNEEDRFYALCNIVNTGSVEKLAENLHTKVVVSDPAHRLCKGSDIPVIDGIDDYGRTILISTAMEFGDLPLYGEVFILTQEDSIEWLKNAVDRALDDLVA